MGKSGTRTTLARPEQDALDHQWWAMSPDEALQALGSGDSGLSQAEAAARLERFGRNRLQEEEGINLVALWFRQFKSPLIYLLLAAAVVTLLLEEFVDTGVIAAVLLLNAIIGFSQEFRAERSAEALRRLAVAHARVLRDKREREIEATDLVPGDIVLIEAGMMVPADCRLLHAAALESDESLLTGESTTVAKTAGPLDVDTPVADRANMLFMGSVVTRGRARAMVVATGAATQLGDIAGSVQQITRTTTPMQERISRFARLIGFAIIGGAALAFVVGLIAGVEPADLLLLLVALAVAAIPEGLPIVLTVTLAIGVSRMASRNVIIRQLPAVETLGSCNVIGSDKTGTLTQNRMIVQHIDAGGVRYEVTGEGYGVEGEILRDGQPVDLDQEEALRLTLLAGALCNDAGLVATEQELEVHGDPTEIALLIAAARAGIYKDDVEERYERKAEVPFDSDRRWAATVNDLHGKDVLFVKGAPEAIVALCEGAYGGAPLDRDAVLDGAHRMASEGLRVLAMAYRETGAQQERVHEEVKQLTFLGLQGMMDPPRPEATEAVRECQNAGIRVVMITGDHATTGLAIARMLGIAKEEDAALTGRDLDAMDEEEFERSVATTSVYARVSPQHKHRVVAALQRQGNVVAVTGDGVNDAPALKAADIGAAMGRSGTDVAKEAADMVVTDDNFASIVAAVEQGRIVFDNVRKVTFFLVSTGVGTVLAVVAAPAMGYDVPFFPAQLLWLNLVTKGIQDVALAFEEGEPGILQRPPRARNEGVISSLLWERSAIVGIVLAIGTLALFIVELEAGESLEQARTVALTTMVLFQMFHVGNSRSEYLSLFRKSPLSNPFLFIGTATALALHIAALYLPPTQFVLRVEPLDLVTWVRMMAVALTIIIAIELHKLIRGGRTAYLTGVTRPEAAPAAR